MSAPIRVRLGHSPVLRKIHNEWVNQGWRRKFYWHCTSCIPSQFESNGGTADTIAAAADAGREHLREAHTDRCDAPDAQEASVDVQGENGPQNAAQQYANTYDTSRSTT